MLLSLLKISCIHWKILQGFFTNDSQLIHKEYYPMRGEQFSNSENLTSFKSNSSAVYKLLFLPVYGWHFMIYLNKQNIHLSTCKHLSTCNNLTIELCNPTCLCWSTCKAKLCTGNNYILTHICTYIHIVWYYYDVVLYATACKSELEYTNDTSYFILNGKLGLSLVICIYVTCKID